MNKSFWNGKTVLVTGVNGFIGSWLAKELLDADAEVAGIGKSGNKQYLDGLGIASKIDLINCDVSNFFETKKIIKEINPSICFHLASQSLTGKSVIDPVYTFKTEIEGSWNVLESFRQKDSCDGIVVASSVRAYEKKESDGMYTEKDALLGQQPYDCSKACIDLITRYYAKSYGLPATVCRATNTYGGNDLTLNRVISKFVDMALHNRDIAIQGDGLISKDFLYVKDTVNAYLTLGEKASGKKVRGEAFNFATGKQSSIKSIAEKIVEYSNPKLKVTTEKFEWKKELDEQPIDFSKARETLGWKPEYDLDAGLKETIDWFKDYFKGGKK